MENVVSTSLFTGINYSLQDIVLNILLTAILTLLVSYFYKRTHNGISYSKSFAFTIVVIGILIAIVMMVIGSNLAVAFGALGAFSLVRFRTAVKDTKDTVYIFISVVIGMAVGTGNYMIAIVATIILILLILFLEKIKFGSNKKFNYILTYTISSQLTGDNRIKDMFKKYIKGEALLNVSARQKGEFLDMTFNVNLFKEEDLDKFTKSLSSIDGISDVNIIASKGDIEY